jgi:hypothetical protein
MHKIFQRRTNNNSMPPAMEAKPTKRNCPSLSSIMRWNVWRHARGASKGKAPSSTSIRPKAISSGLSKTYFLPPASRMYLKNSESGCNTSTSLLLLKLLR